MKQIVRAAGLVVAAFLSVGANGNWNTNVVETDRGYEIGNPDADVHLIEFVSYTCPHCADFTIQGEAPLQLAYIGPGKMKFEVRSFIRNDVDLAATMLVQCGDNSKFLQNHTMFMTKQSAWLGEARKASDAQLAQWLNGSASGRQSMASALGFYKMMETRGYGRPELDKCLSDQALADRLSSNTQKDMTDFGVRGTPSFVVNGALLENVHGWQPLEQHLNTLY
ncbi:DsbA family protein [Pontixanthobacter luteolus]|uniref:DsbA family protein n=1 Tax=Pontixanthobacter luteolus TaxID=295089 RepID=UPI002303558E|nr:thioredoxin domain-containing protein [Pontixanthobacter luteolus]